MTKESKEAKLYLDRRSKLTALNHLQEQVTVAKLSPRPSTSSTGRKPNKVSKLWPNTGSISESIRSSVGATGAPKGALPSGGSPAPIRASSSKSQDLPRKRHSVCSSVQISPATSDLSDADPSPNPIQTRKRSFTAPISLGQRDSLPQGLPSFHSSRSSISSLDKGLSTLDGTVSEGNNLLSAPKDGSSLINISVSTMGGGGLPMGRRMRRPSIFPTRQSSFSNGGVFLTAISEGSPGRGFISKSRSGSLSMYKSESAGQVPSMSADLEQFQLEEISEQPIFLRGLRALATHLIKYLARILKNPIEWGWEYDPVTHLLPDSNSRPRIPSLRATLGLTFNDRSSSIFSTEAMKQMSRKKEFGGWLIPEMRELFRKAPEDRTESDIDQMAAWCASMKGFRKFTPPVQKSLLRIARYERWNMGRTIIKEGHKAYRFYVILDGEVEVLKIDRQALAAATSKKAPTTATSGNGNKDQGDASGSQELAVAPPGDGGGGGQEATATGQTSNVVNERAYTKVLGIQSSGESFGDLSFSTDGIRMASIQTRRTTEFLIVERDDFMSIMAEAATVLGAGADLIHAYEFLMASVPLFKTLRIDSNLLPRFCELRTFPPNTPIIVEGDYVESIWFIR
ncbi:Cyclic nucleotide-binding domain-containing protein 2, partial [Quaeritorhiza haematococci]